MFNRNSERFILKLKKCYYRKIQRGKLSAMCTAETEAFLYQEERFKDSLVYSNTYIF